MNKKTSTTLAVVIILVLAIVFVVVAMSNTKTNKVNTGNKSQVKQKQTQNDVNNSMANENNQVNIEKLQGAEAEVPGASLVKDNEVITPEGEIVQNDVEPATPQAPQETPPLAENQIPSGSTALTISGENGYVPSSFTVNAGEVVTLTIKSGDKFTHVFKFNDESLSAVAVGVGPHEIRAITFKVPSNAGEYSFYCDVPGHSSRGEVGKMIVK